MQNINVILFDDFTILDAFGPVDVLSKLDKLYKVDYYSQNGGLIKTNQTLTLSTRPFSEITDFDILLIPGGFGTRRLVDVASYIADIKILAEKSKKVLTVCTGSALLAKTGLLKNIKATSNKISFDWVMSQDTEVNWIRQARWIVDGKYYTSSGITAGIDMALGFVKDTISEEVAEKIARGLEYCWNKNSEEDHFA